MQKVVYIDDGFLAKRDELNSSLKEGWFVKYPPTTNGSWAIFVLEKPDLPYVSPDIHGPGLSGTR